jgi:hypothetical protein
MRPDVQTGLTLGAIAGVATLGLNLINVAILTGNGCHQRGTILPFVAFVVFLILAGVAGKRAEAAGGSAPIAGAVTGVASGIAMPILLLFGIVTATNANACAGASPVDLISLTAIGGILGLVIFLAGVAVGAAAGAVGALFGGSDEAATA